MVPDPEAVFLKKARADLVAARCLAGDINVDDGSVGFHCQQAVEKSSKALLASRNVPFKFGHDLQLYLNKLDADGLTPPMEVAAAAWLTPFGTDFRCLSLAAAPAGAAPFDRRQALDLAAAGVAWAEQHLLGL